MKRKIAILLGLALFSSTTNALAIDVNTPIRERPFETSNLPFSIKRSVDEKKQINLQQSFVDLFTGAATVSLPLAVPPGFSKATPSLTLEYSSQRVMAPTAFGHSWQVPLGKIVRRQKPGVATLYNQEEFRIQTPTFQDDLVLLQTNGDSETYGLERETSFPLIHRNRATNSWMVTTTDGVLYSYGARQDTREGSADGLHTYSWQIESVVDLNGNRIDYQYHRIGNLLYPQKIAYGSQQSETHPFAIVFEPFDQVDPIENQPQPYTDLKAGFPRAYRHRIDAISVQIQGVERIRYELEYSNPTKVDRSELIALTAVAPASFATAARETSFAYHQTAQAPQQALRLLKSVTYPNGGTFSLQYQTANAISKNGTLVNPRPHTPTTVVSSVTASDATGRMDETTYFYEQGYYYHQSALQREAAGFGVVTVTDPLGHTTASYFHQGRGLPSKRFFSQDDKPLIGKSYRTVRTDANTSDTQTSYQEWKAVVLQPERWFVYSELSVDQFNDGTSSRSTATGRTYDAMYGNLEETIEYGEVELTADGFTDVLTDSRQQIQEHSHNDSQYIHSLPASESLYDHENDLVTRTSYRYDNLPEEEVKFGNKTHERRWLKKENRDIVTAFTHTSNGQVDSVLSPRQGTTSLVYELLGLYPHEVTNALQHTTTYDFDLFTGEAIGSKDPNGMEAKRTLDGHGRWILQEESNAEGILQPRLRRAFDESVQPNAYRTIIIQDNAQEADVIEYHDGFGRTIQRRTQQTDAEVFSVTESTFDALGREATSTVNVFVTGDAYVPLLVDTPKTITDYDAFNRVVSVADANGTTATAYDAAGAVKLVTDPNTHRIDYTYDAFDRLVGVTEHNRGEMYQTYYTYDARDLLINLQDSEENVRSISYDSLGRLQQLEDLHQADNTSPPLWSFAYDDADNVTQTVDPRHQVVAAQYDLLDRVQNKTFIDEDQIQTQTVYSYDQGQYGIGRLSALTAPAYSWLAHYDVRGRVTQESVALNGVSFTKNTTYTSVDEPKTVTYPNGETITYEYNNVGQLQEIKLGADTVVGPIAYTADSLIKQLDYGNAGVSRFTRDPTQMLRLTAKETTLGNELLQDLSYGYDPVGNITQLTDSAPTAINRSLSYSYDERDRLETATVAGEPATTYVYSPVGNIISVNGSTYQYADSQTDHPHAVQSISGEGTATLIYDQAGNVTQLSWVGDSYLSQYNARNELALTEHITNARSQKTSYSYDDKGRRLRKVERIYQLPRCGYPSGSSASSSSYSYYPRYGGYGTTIPWPNSYYGGYGGSASASSGGYGSYSSHNSSSYSSSSSTPITCDPILRSIRTTRYPFDDYQVDPSGDARVAITADQEHVATLVKGAVTSCGDGSDHSSDHGSPCLPTRSVYYHHDDHLGGSSVVTDQAGAVTELLDYEPFGAMKTKQQQGSYDAVEKFTGYELDDDTGLYYAGARYYHPILRRFTAIDPLQQKPTELLERFGENPQGLNAYSYANNNPLILVDPTGEFAIAAPAVPYAAAAIVALAGAFHFRDSLDDVSRAITDIAAGSASRIKNVLSPKPESPKGKQNNQPPLLPSRREREQLLDKMGRVRDGGVTTESTALDLATEQLGPGYREISSPGTGIFRSKDGLRQVRLTRSEIGPRQKSPHLNFEYGKPKNPAKPFDSFSRQSNRHLFLQ